MRRFFLTVGSIALLAVCAFVSPGTSTSKALAAPAKAPQVKLFSCSDRPLPVCLVQVEQDVNSWLVESKVAVLQVTTSSSSTLPVGAGTIPQLTYNPVVVSTVLYQP
jgi:hypothetical protein